MFSFFSKLRSKIVNWCIQKEDTCIQQLVNEKDTVAIPGQDLKLKFTKRTVTRDLFVWAPGGWKPVKSAMKTVPYKVWNLVLSNGMRLSAADEHLIATEFSITKMKDLKLGTSVHTEQGWAYVLDVHESYEEVEMFDLEVNSEDHLYHTNGITSHNTTVAAMYILWYSMFNEAKTCIIASKAQAHATEIISRIQFTYEELPSWIKPGSKFFAKTYMEFANNSKIKVEATSEKTGRGDSPSILFIDELAFVPRRIQQEMWASITPSLSTGGKLILTSTPNGDGELFAEQWRNAMSGSSSIKPMQILYWRHPGRGKEYYKEMLGKLGAVVTRQELLCVAGDTLVSIDNETLPIGEVFSLLKLHRDLAQENEE